MFSQAHETHVPENGAINSHTAPFFWRRFLVRVLQILDQILLVPDSGAD